MANPKRLLRRLPARSNRGAEKPAIIIPDSFVIARMPRNPEKQKSWKDGADRAGHQFNAGPFAERHATRRAQIEAAAGERRRHRTELMKTKSGMYYGAGIAACADPIDREGTVWGDDDEPSFVFADPFGLGQGKSASM